jgi:hypothetical protein
MALHGQFTSITLISNDKSICKSLNKPKHSYASAHTSLHTTCRWRSTAKMPALLAILVAGFPGRRRRLELARPKAHCHGSSADSHRDRGTQCKTCGKVHRSNSLSASGAQRGPTECGSAGGQQSRCNTVRLEHHDRTSNLRKVHQAVRIECVSAWRLTAARAQGSPTSQQQHHLPTPATTTATTPAVQQGG